MTFFLAMLLSVQPTSGTPVDSASMNPAQRRAAEAISSWMTCLAPQVADRSFADAAAADEAASATLSGCRDQDQRLRAAFEAGLPAERARSLRRNLHQQFREQVRRGTIRRQPAQAD